MGTLIVNPGWPTLLKGGVAAAGALVLLLSWLAHRRGRLDRWRPLRDGLLLALGLTAGLCWWNLGGFREAGYIHVWDTFHYYMGGKYFRELGYERLYLCSALADAEDGFLDAGARRRIRDLSSNTLVPAVTALAEPDRCRRHFTPERWIAFKHDLAWFRARVSPRLWAAAQGDHGYNASPAWGVLGTLLASTGPASTPQILVLTLVDPALLIAMWAAVAWAFGWRAMCVAMIYWGTNFAAGFSWHGGAYLRQDWLVATIVGLCLLRRGWTAAGGAALATATLLRVFPGLVFAGVLLQAIAGRIRAVAPPPEGERRFAAGVVLAAIVLLPVSTVVADGVAAWPGFVSNSAKHAGTPLTNHMGLKTVVAFDPSTRASVSAPLSLEVDPFAVWKEARLRTFAERRWLYAGLVAAFALLLALAVRGRPMWVAAVLGVGLIPVVAELTCYYYSVLLAYGLLWSDEDWTGAALAVLSAVTCVIPAVTSWDDVRYTAMSAAVLTFVVGATTFYAARRVY